MDFPCQDQCGCYYRVDPKWQVPRVLRCHLHAEGSIHETEEYYNKCCRSAPTHRQELYAALPDLELPGGSVLEVGCGYGTYVPLFLRKNYDYTGLDPSTLACQVVNRTYDVRTLILLFEEMPEDKFDLIFSAHSLEHMAEGPAAIAKMRRMCKQLILILPYGPDDWWNPQHLWFYTDESLTRVLNKVGFNEVKTVVKKVTDHERFIYCEAK